MGYDVKYQEGKKGLSIDMFLDEIKISAEITEKEMLREAGKVAKAEVERQLNRIKRTGVNRYGRKALADDVKLSVRKNKWGDYIAQVKGGKNTGTLWHVVNDGNLYSRPTFFLDGALNNLDKSIDNIWNKIGKIMG